MPYIRRFSVGALGIAFLLLSFSAAPLFAETFERTVSARLRMLLSFLSGLFPFSLTELVLLLLLPTLLFLVALSIRTKSPTLLASRLLFSLFCYLALFTTAFAPGLYRPPLEARLSLTPDAPTEGELLSCASYLSRLAASPPPTPAEEEISLRIEEAYAVLGKRYGICVNPAASAKRTKTPLLSHLGYFGLYAFPFGEVTVVKEVSDVRYGFTLAHELAHASGFAREEEADIMAFLACIESGDPYLAYVGAAGMLDRLLSELYVTSPALWQAVSEGLPPTAREDLSDAGDVSFAATLARPTPDYSKTVRLLCALIRAREKFPEYTVQ